MIVYDGRNLKKYTQWLMNVNQCHSFKTLFLKRSAEYQTRFCNEQDVFVIYCLNGNHVQAKCEYRNQKSETNWNTE